VFCLIPVAKVQTRVAKATVIKDRYGPQRARTYLENLDMDLAFNKKELRALAMAKREPSFDEVDYEYPMHKKESKHKYPPNQIKNSLSPVPASGQDVTCFGCGGTGHRKHECPSVKKNKGK
jgi:hypothetical protein